MSESQYIPDPDELEDDAVGEQDELYEHYSITADRGQSPLRLDKFLTIHMERCSRNRIQTAADAGNILVNGKPAKSSYKVKPGDRISLVMPYPKREVEIVPQNIPLDIPYEDDDLLIVDKPAGMVVHPGHGNWDGTLVNALTYHLRTLPMFREGDLRAGLVHRIDKDTSGPSSFSTIRSCAATMPSCGAIPTPTRGRSRAISAVRRRTSCRCASSRTASRASTP